MHLISILLLFILNGIFIGTTFSSLARTTDGNAVNNIRRSSTFQLLLSRRRRTTYPTAKQCFKDFFVEDKTPTGFRKSSKDIRYICQNLTSKTKTYFASLFDTSYGIPIYSGYVIKKADASKFGTSKDRNEFKWRTEPKGISLQANDETYESQITYAKGHLLPAKIYSFTKENHKSTFTYTNAVPQVSGFNSGQWAQYERLIRDYAQNTCSKNNGDLYLITGISEAHYETTVSSPIQEKLKDFRKIKIPRSMWTAGCCVGSTSKAVLSNFAVVGNNLKDKNKVLMTELSVTDLEKFILAGVKGFGGSSIDLFPGNSKCSDKSKIINIKKRPNN